MQGRTAPIAIKFLNDFKVLETVLPDLRSREPFWYWQGESRESFGIAGRRAALDSEW
jgi:hypothetical protein